MTFHRPFALIASSRIRSLTALGGERPSAARRGFPAKGSEGAEGREGRRPTCHKRHVPWRRRRACGRACRLAGRGVGPLYTAASLTFPRPPRPHPLRTEAPPLTPPAPHPPAPQPLPGVWDGIGAPPPSSSPSPSPRCHPPAEGNYFCRVQNRKKNKNKNPQRDFIIVLHQEENCCYWLGFLLRKLLLGLLGGASSRTHGCTRGR